MNETIQTLLNRRSCRSYTDEAVSKEDLDTILEAGLHAPSGMNTQNVRLIAVQDPETVAKLSQMNAAVAGFNMNPFYGAKTVIAVVAKKEGVYPYDGPLALGNMLNAAYALGLGACWIHRAKEVFASEEGKAMLLSWGVTEDVEGIGFCIVGHVKEDKDVTPIKDGRVFYVGC